MTQVQPHDRQIIPGIKDMLAVSSGKGGVGKSTVSVNLALALVQQGLRIGLLDTDIYGPNVPGMLGLEDRPTADPQSGLLQPCNVRGLKALSMGLLIEPGIPVIWRGPMLAKMMNQFLFQTDWGELDLLILDLPPGTGDVQISLTQNAPLTAALIVTTPSEIALEDVRRGVKMFQQTEVPVLGLVENMSHFVCDACQQSSHPFGRDGGLRTAADFELPLLGQIPLDQQLTLCAESGNPVVQAVPQSPAGQALTNLGSQVMARLADLENA
jgi:ATP-binding protein involved in chromosome partitioning